MYEWQIERERKAASDLGDNITLFDAGADGGVVSAVYNDDPKSPHYLVSHWPLCASTAAGYVMAQEEDTLKDLCQSYGDKIELKPTELRTKLLQGRYIDLRDERALLREALHDMSPSELDELGIESLAPGPIRRDHEER